MECMDGVNDKVGKSIREVGLGSYISFWELPFQHGIHKRVIRVIYIQLPARALYTSLYSSNPSPLF